MNYTHPAFLEMLLRRHAPDQDLRVVAVEPLPLDNSASILVTLTAGQTTQPIGHLGLRLTVRRAGGLPETHQLVLKVKPNGRQITAMLTTLAQACGSPLAEVFPPLAARAGFEHTHHRELEVYANCHSPLLPRIWGLHVDPAPDLYLILMEYLADVQLLNSVMTPAHWTDAHLRAALRQLAAWHARYLDQPLPLAPAYAWTDAPSAAYYQQLSPLWEALLTNAVTHAPTLYTAPRVALLRQALTDLPTRWQALEVERKTLVHNDLNPRNTCFKVDAAGQLQFCAYDWELATRHVPPYDVVELLCFVLDADRYHLRLPYLDYYRQELHARTGHYPDALAFQRLFGRAALDFGLHRLGMYLMAHAVSPYPFLPRVVDSFFDTLAQTGNRTT